MSPDLTAARLDEIVHDSTLSIDDKIQALLQLGLETFQLGLGIISHVDRRDYRVDYVAPPSAGLLPGTYFSLARTYCDITLKLRYTLAIDNMGTSAHKAHPCYTDFKLETYFGTPLIVNGEIYGTLNFTAPQSRGASFSPEDKAQLELLGQAVASLIAQRTTLTV